MKMLLFNFLVTVFSGFILRLNIVVGILGVTHKFLLESHSHFAFYGWLAQCIYVFAWRHLKQKTGRELNVFRWILTLNLVASYGMLFTFFWYGYYWLAIVFSSIALFTGIFYGVTLFKNTRQSTGPETIWLRAGAIFAAVSSFGIGGIAYASHKPELETLFRAATYFYLHFQYNGFFIFSAIGIFFTVLKNTHRRHFPINTNLFLLLFVSSVITYGLSLLWMDLDSMLLNALKIVGIIQFAGSVLLVLLLRQRCIKSLKYTLPASLFLWIFTCAFILKFFLQMIAPFESFRIFAAQDRASIIAFLHLVLLPCLSVFRGKFRTKTWRIF